MTQCSLPGRLPKFQRNILPCFKPMLTYNANTWTLTKRIKSKIEAMDMKVRESIKRKRRRNRFRNEFFEKELEFKVY
jgi:hypothetical protein